MEQAISSSSCWRATRYGSTGFESRALALTKELHWQTTAHSLAYALILLALHPDEQERLHAHIASVLPDGRAPVRPLSAVTLSAYLAQSILMARVGLCRCDRRTTT